MYSPASCISSNFMIYLHIYKVILIIYSRGEMTSRNDTRKLGRYIFVCEADLEILMLFVSSSVNILNWKNDRTGWQDVMITGWQDDKSSGHPVNLSCCHPVILSVISNPELPNDPVTKWPSLSEQVTKWPSDQVTKWRRRLTVWYIFFLSQALPMLRVSVFNRVHCGVTGELGDQWARWPPARAGVCLSPPIYHHYCELFTYFPSSVS